MRSSVGLLAVVAALLAVPPVEAQRAYLVAAAGDVACDPRERGRCRDDATAGLLEGADAVLMLGDGQYRDGALWKYRTAYHRTWGRYKTITRPVPGNHEYGAPGASGYFAYFGAAAGPAGSGYYSFDLGPWHLVALNSNCWAVGGCGPGSPQYRWLAADLAAHPSRCTLAFWHHPLYTAGRYTGFPDVRPFWELLYAAGAEVVLNGHDHNYQRYAPMDPHGRRDPRGIREFVVGTGGRSLYRLRPDPLAAREAATDRTFGVLRLRLEPGGYTWEFAAVSSAAFTDRGSGRCHE
jgi:hypothetical protein